MNEYRASTLHWGRQETSDHCICIQEEWQWTVHIHTHCMYIQGGMAMDSVHPHCMYTRRNDNGQFIHPHCMYTKRNDNGQIIHMHTLHVHVYKGECFDSLCISTGTHMLFYQCVYMYVYTNYGSVEIFLAFYIRTTYFRDLC